MPYLLSLAVLFGVAVYVNNTAFWAVTFIIFTLAIYVFSSWYIESFAPYQPTNGLKFELPPSDLYPFKHHWMSFEIDPKDPSNITLEHVKDPTQTALPCIHYVDESPPSADNKTCFLLCHGNPTWSFLYRKIIPSLRGQYRCVSIDCPGFGISTAPANYPFTSEQHAYVITAVVKKLGLSDLVLVQQDWGGPTGFFFATDESLKQAGVTIKGFVIGNTWCWPIDRRRRWDVVLFSLVFGGWLGRVLGFGNNFVIKSFWFKGFYKTHSSSVRYWYNKPFEGKYARKGTWIWPKQIFDKRCNQLLKQAETKMLELYGKNVPCLLLWGMRDPAFIENVELKKFKLMFVDHEVIKLKDASHFWQEDAGDEAGMYILAWAQEKF